MDGRIGVLSVSHKLLTRFCCRDDNSTVDFSCLYISMNTMFCLLTTLTILSIYITISRCGDLSYVVSLSQEDDLPDSGIWEFF